MTVEMLPGKVCVPVVVCLLEMISAILKLLVSAVFYLTVSGQV